MKTTKAISMREIGKETLRSKIMLPAEQRRVMSVLVEQASSSDPERTDFYYRQYTAASGTAPKRAAQNRLSESRSKLISEKEKTVAIEGILGVITKKSHHRQQEKLQGVEYAGKEIAPDKEILLERIYSLLYLFEPEIRRAARGDPKGCSLEEIYSEITKLFYSNRKNFAELAATAKGLSLLESLLAEDDGSVLLSLLDFPESPFFLPGCDPALVESSVEKAIAPGVATVLRMASEKLLLFIEKMKTVERSFFVSKPGQILLYAALSQYGKIKLQAEKEAWSHCVCEVYNRIKESTGELFEAYQLEEEKQNFYTWRLFSLLPLFLPEDSRGELLLLLKTRICSGVKDGRVEGIDCFLRVFGVSSGEVKEAFG